MPAPAPDQGAAESRRAQCGLEKELFLRGAAQLGPCVLWLGLQTSRQYPCKLIALLCSQGEVTSFCLCHFAESLVCKLE